MFLTYTCSQSESWTTPGGEYWHAKCQGEGYNLQTIDYERCNCECHQLKAFCRECKRGEPCNTHVVELQPETTTLDLDALRALRNQLVDLLQMIDAVIESRPPEEEPAEEDKLVEVLDDDLTVMVTEKDMEELQSLAVENVPQWVRDREGREA